MRKPFTIFLGLIFTTLQGYGTQEELKQCTSTKEYITTYNYLKDNEQLGFSEKEIQDTALKVAKSCTGAAKRFIWTFETLMATQAAARNSLVTAIELAGHSDTHAKTFLEVFKKSYLKNHLDLDYKTSLRLARSLSLDYSGDPKMAGEDFVNIVHACTDEKWLALSKPKCGRIAEQVIRSGEVYGQQVAKHFTRLMKFITSEKGPSSSLQHALDISLKVIAKGPEAPENFIQAYRFGINAKGLQLSAEKALNFAQDMTALSVLSEDSPRLPASKKAP